MKNIQFLLTSVRIENESGLAEINTISHSSLNSVFETLNWFVDRNAIYTYTTFKLKYYVQAIKILQTDPLVTINMPVEYNEPDVYRKPILMFTDRGTPIWDEENIFYKQYNDNKTNEQASIN